MQAEGGYTGVDNLEVMAGAINYRRYLTDLVADVAPVGGRLVDFGAGTGTHAEDLRDRGFSVVCVEADAGLCDRLRGKGFEAYQDLEDAGVETADVVYSINVLEHIGDDAGVVSAISAKMRPGSRLVVYVPAFPSLFTAMDEKVGHVRRYRAKPLRLLLQRSGLRVVRLSYADALGFPATLLYKARRSQTGNISPAGLKLYDRVAFPVSRRVDVLTGKLFGKNLLAVAVK